FFCSVAPPTDFYTLSLHDALPIYGWQLSGILQVQSGANLTFLSSGTNFGMNLNSAIIPGTQGLVNPDGSHGITITSQSILGSNADRKSTRLNSSHEWISYAVFCLK